MRGPVSAAAGLAMLAAALAGCLVDSPAPTPSPTPPAPYAGFLPPEATLAAGAPRVLAPVNYLVTPGTGPANELVIAVNPKDPLNLVAGGKDYYLGTTHPCPATPSGSSQYPINVWTGVYWSKDGGKTWHNALMPGHPADTRNASHPNRAFPCNSDPVVVFDQDGTAYFSGLGIRGENVPDPSHPCVQTGSSIWVMKSTDGGATWRDFSCVSAGTYLPQPAGGVNVDKQWFAVDGPHLYFTYMAFNPTDVDLVMRHSGDAGRTWGPEVPLFEFPTADNPDQVQSGRQFSTPQVGPDGTVYATWRAFGAEGGVWFTKSIDRGTTFEPSRRIAPVTPIPGQLVPGKYRTSSYPVLAVSLDGNHSGTLHVVWSDAKDGDADVLYMRSGNGGAGWTDPVRLNADGVAGSHQFLPWITVAPSGDVHAVWLDSRAYPNATLLDVYHRASRDGGLTWGDELRVNAETIETAACHHQSGANFIGDYLGLAASHLAVHPFWPDGRSGRCEGMTAALLP